MVAGSSNPFMTTSAQGGTTYSPPQSFPSAPTQAFTDPVGNRTFRPGQVLPTSQPGDLPIPQIQPQADTYTRQNFLPPELMAPFYNAAGVNANMGTMWAGMMPQVQGYLSGMLSPNLNPMEQAFMNTSAQDAAELMQQMMGQQEAEYHNTPFHSAVPQMQANVFDQFNRNLLNVGSQMGLQRMQLANQAAMMPISGLQQSLNFGPDMAERLFNMANNAYMQPYQLPLNVYSQEPFNAPTMVQSQGSGGGKK